MWNELWSVRNTVHLKRMEKSWPYQTIGSEVLDIPVPMFYLLSTIWQHECLLCLRLQNPSNKSLEGQFSCKIRIGPIPLPSVACNCCCNCFFFLKWLAFRIGTHFWKYIVIPLELYMSGAASVSKMWAVRNPFIFPTILTGRKPMWPHIVTARQILYWVIPLTLIFLWDQKWFFQQH